MYPVKFLAPTVAAVDSRTVNVSLGAFPRPTEAATVRSILTVATPPTRRDYLLVFCVKKASASEITRRFVLSASSGALLFTTSSTDSFGSRSK